MSFKPIKDGHGRVVGVEFRPTMKMLRVVVEFNKAENCKLPTEEILKSAGVAESEWRNWNNNFIVHEYGPDGELTASKNHFDEWFDSALSIKPGEERQMLREIGMQKALSGDFNFWKELARTYAATTKEEAPRETKAIPFNLPTNATKEQLLEFRQKLLEQQRSVDGSGQPGLARLTSKRS